MSISLADRINPPEGRDQGDPCKLSVLDHD